MIIGMFDCRTRKSCQVKVLNFSFIKNSAVSSTRQLTEKAQTIGHRNMTIRKVFRAMFPLRNEEGAFGRSYVYVDLRHKDIKYQQCYRLTPLLMTLKLVSSLVPGNKTKRCLSFDCFLLFPTSPAPSQNSCKTQQCTSLDQFNGNAHLNGSQVVIKPQCTDPNAPITMGMTFVLTSPIFRTFLARSWYFLQLFHLLYHHHHHHHHHYQYYYYCYYYYYYYYHHYYYCFVIAA